MGVEAIADKFKKKRVATVMLITRKLAFVCCFINYCQAPFNDLREDLNKIKPACPANTLKNVKLAQ